MTPSGQTITADNGTIISVPNSAQSVPPTAAGSKTGPLHAMQAMRPGVIGAPPLQGAAALAAAVPSPAAVKKKRAPQEKKKRNTKVFVLCLSEWYSRFYIQKVDPL